jgi:hypothetical protein
VIGSQKTRQYFAEIFSRVLLTLNHPNVTLNLILTNAVSSNQRSRILSAFLLPLLPDSQEAERTFRSLANDPIPAVRVAALNSLKSGISDRPIIEKVIDTTVNDPSREVRIALIDVIAEVAPHLTTEFIQLMTDPGVVSLALLELPRMIEMTGIWYFRRHSKMQHRLIQKQLHLQCGNPCTSPNEGPSLSLLFQKFSKTELFEETIIDSIGHFGLKEKVAGLICFPEGQKWRDREAFVGRCLTLVPYLGANLGRLGRDVAQVRNKSVDLWIALVNTDAEVIRDLCELARGIWQGRLVAAKVALRIGPINPDFKKLTEVLSSDSVGIIRDCLCGKA